jgi:hypothetical protein
MKMSLKFALVAFTAFIVTTAAFTQEWTKAQKEVWQLVENSWTKWKAGDIQGSEAYMHEKYQGWNDQLPLPLTKEMVMKRDQEMKDNFKIDYFSLNPARIVITENAAVVDYYYTFEATYTKGEEKELIESNGQNAEFYIKEGGKWLLLGDMTTIKGREYNHKDDD